MIHSMTGYGEAQVHEGGITYRVQIRSLNNRYFKLTTKLPEPFQLFESEVEKQLRSRLGRGSLTLTLRIRDETPAGGCEINIPLLRRYVEQIERAIDGRPTLRLDVATLVNLPGVCQPPEFDETVQGTRLALLKKLTDVAVEKLIAMRAVEGKSLLKDLAAQCDVVREHTAAIRERSPTVVVEYQERLQTRVQELLNAGQFKLEADALAREVAVFAERCDVNEEVARIDGHLQHFESLCAAPEETGRKLEFLAQELLREANTIGSKANDADIARRTVEMKAAIDRIKEQVQNVE